MKREDLKMYTLRHFLFYMGVAAAAGAITGALASAMDWSTALIYAVGLSACAVISILALREGLFDSSRRADARRRRHA